MGGKQSRVGGLKSLSEVCSCSGCQNEEVDSVTEASQRINLELILDELKVLAMLIDTVKVLLSFNLDQESECLHMLGNLQHMCAKWWEIS